MNALRQYTDLPIDFGNFRFLVRAVDDIGKAHFSDKWPRLIYVNRPEEPLPEMVGERSEGWTFNGWPPDNPDEIIVIRRSGSRDADIVRRALLLIRSFHPERIPAKKPLHPSITSSGSGMGMPDPTDHISMENYQLAKTITEQAYPSQKASWDMYCNAKNLTLEAFRSGELIAHLRPKIGGSFTQVPLLHWNYDKAEVRFEHFDMSNSDPYSTVSGDDRLDWIFVEKASLTKLLATLSRKRTPQITATSRTATKADMLAMMEHFGNQYPTIKQAEEWQQKHAPSISRGSFRNAWRDNSPIPIKRGPKGPRK